MIDHLLDNKHLLFLSLVLIFVAGLSAIVALPRQEDPRIVHRNPLILTMVPGASAERVEALVTEPIETALEEVDEIMTIESTSRAGFSFVVIELQSDVGAGENEQVFSKIRDKLGEAEAEFPPEAQAPVFEDQRPAAAYTVLTAVRWAGSGEPSLGLMTRIAEDLADNLRAQSGTEIVRTFGGADEEITVTVDPPALASLGMSAGQVSQALTAADAKAPGGLVYGALNELQLEVSGELDSAARIRDVPLRTGPNGEATVRVGDVATVVRGRQMPPSSIALAEGERVVLVAARAQPDIRADLWAEEAVARIEEFETGLGGGVRVDLLFNQIDYTNERLVSLATNLVAGALVVALVIFITMGWRAAIVVGLALPLTACLVLFATLLSDGALHQMSIFGMIIATGLLIDNAIVVTDEVRKRLQGGEGPHAAVRHAVRHLFAPLLASTLTTVLAFMPIVLLPGNAGDFVGSIGLSVNFALVFSFALSLTLIAALVGLFGRGKRDPKERSFLRDGIQSPEVKRLLHRFLTFSYRVPLVGLALASALPVAGFAVAPSLGRQFFPATDRNMFEIEVWLPRESAIGHTRARVDALEAWLVEQPEVRGVHWVVGRSYPSVYYNMIERNDASPHYANGVVYTQTAAQVIPLIERFNAWSSAATPDLKIVADNFAQGPPVFADIVYRVFGPNLDTLQTIGEELKAALQEHPDVLETAHSMPRGEPKLWFDADEDAARIAGYSLSGLTEQLQAGLVGATGGAVLEDLENLPVRVRYPDDWRGTIGGVMATQFASGEPGQFVPFEALGELALRPERGGITRYNGLRAAIIEGHARQETLPIEIATGVVENLRANGWEMPPGYRLEYGGDVEQDARALGDLSTFLPVIVTLMLATLILAFRRVRLAVLLSLVGVLSVGLAMLSTWMINFPFGFNTILGTIGLIGVALNDSIVVLASIRALPEARAGDRAAVATAVLGCFRHVTSTTLTTAGGFLPLLLFQPGDFWPQLAIVLAGGVIGATILAVFFVPAGYCVLMAPRGPRQEASP